MASRFHIAASISIGLAAIAGSAQAGTGGRFTGQTASYVYSRFLTLEAGRSYTIETQNLSAGADTILHVQSNDTGGYIAGNDDCATSLPGCTGLRSYLTIPSSPSARSVRVIVRAYNASSGGTALLRIVPSGLSAIEQAITFSSGYSRQLASFVQQTHFSSVEEQGGSSDTIMLVTSGSPSHAIGFDDDSGVDRMSMIHAAESCSSSCIVVVGAYSPSYVGVTTFVWDEDAHYLDNDNDGLGNGLENVLGTSEGEHDTDYDGLDDGVEVYGIDNTLLKFPFYGADPLWPDVFVEADWRECTQDPANLWSCGDPNNPSWPDHWRPTGPDSEAVAAFYAPDVRVHFDIGLANSDPSTRTIWGNWGGATRNTAASWNNDKCEYLTQVRRGYFHGGRIYGESGGNSYTPSQGAPGYCFDTGYYSRSVAHELGHNMALYDTGVQSGGVPVACNPLYRSIMSYAIEYASPSIPFSRRAFGSMTLNPSSVSEQSGLGTADQALIGHLTNYAFDYDVKPDGAIDWNRDGRIDATPVRANLSWGWGDGGCNPTGYQESVFGPSVRYTALTRIPVSSSETRIYLFMRREADGLLLYKYATSFPENCGSPPSANCTTNWNTDWPQLDQPGQGSPAATWAWVSGAYKLLLVQNAQGSLKYRYGTPTSSGTTWTASWSLPLPITAAGDPSATVTPSGEAFVYARNTAGEVYEWKLATNGLWSRNLATWDAASGGGTITAASGIGVARGYVGSTERTVAAVPAAGSGAIDLAWRDDSTGQWTRLAAANWEHDRAVTTGQPGIAYVPFNPSVKTVGRFYLAWNPQEPVTMKPLPVELVESEGNQVSLLATDRRLRFREKSVLYRDVWAIGSGNVSLLYDLNYDDHMRGARVFNNVDAGTYAVVFSPLADGSFDGLLRDQDDYFVITQSLRCSLLGTPCNY